MVPGSGIMLMSYSSVQGPSVQGPLGAYTVSRPVDWIKKDESVAVPAPYVVL